MKNQTNLFAIPILLSWILLSGYYAYRSWFDADGLADSMRRDIERLPLWYPTRDYSLSKIGSPFWLWQTRVLSILGLIIGTVFLMLILYLVIIYQ